MNPPNSKSFYIAIGSAVLLLLLLILVSVMLSKQSIKTERQLQVQTNDQMGKMEQKQLPQSFKIGKLPQSVTQLPTVPPSQGYGIDENSLVAKNSEKEIKKLGTFLPYSNTFKTSNGITVSIDIPSLELMLNKWTLLVEISGIDYQVTPGLNSYEPNKTAYREAANSVLKWIQSKGINTQDLVIQWGDKRFIEDRSQEWLQSP